MGKTLTSKWLAIGGRLVVGCTLLLSIWFPRGHYWLDHTCLSTCDLPYTTSLTVDRRTHMESSFNDSTNWNYKTIMIVRRLETIVKNWRVFRNGIAWQRGSRNDRGAHLSPRAGDFHYDWLTSVVLKVVQTPLSCTVCPGYSDVCLSWWNYFTLSLLHPLENRNTFLCKRRKNDVYLVDNWLNVSLHLRKLKYDNKLLFYHVSCGYNLTNVTLIMKK